MNLSREINSASVAYDRAQISPPCRFVASRAPNGELDRAVTSLARDVTRRPLYVLKVAFATLRGQGVPALAHSSFRMSARLRPRVSHGITCRVSIDRACYHNAGIARLPSSIVSVRAMFHYKYICAR